MIRLKDFIKLFNSDKINNQGWVKWECNDNELENLTKILGEKVLDIINSKKININMSVYFMDFKKNYHIGFFDNENHISEYVIIINKKNNYIEIYGKNYTFFNAAIIGSYKWDEIKRWFMK